MIRSVCLLTLFLIAPACADDKSGAKPNSELAPGLTPDELELLPLDSTRRQLLALKNPRVWDGAHYLSRKRRDARRSLTKRKNQKDEKSKALRRQIANYDTRLKPLLSELREALREYGVGDDQLMTLKRLKPPLGPRRDYRYAHRLVLSVPGLKRDAARCDRVARIVHGLDGAQLALLGQRKAIEAVVRETSSKLVPEEKRRLQRMLIRAMERQVGQMERRFWRLSDALLTSPEKQWVRRHLPHRLSRLRDPAGHLYRIPGLKPAQAARIKAQLSELEAEATADRAEARRLQQKRRKARKRPWAEQKVIRDEYRVVQLRVVELTYRIQQESRKILTPAQYAHLMAIPPQVGPRERTYRIDRILKGTPLSLEQQAQVRTIRQRVAAGRRAAYAEAGRVNRMGSNFGPDSPQQQMMQMMRLGMENEAVAALSRGVREVFVKVLSPQQVVAWVVGR